MINLKKYSINILVIFLVSMFSVNLALQGNFKEIQNMFSNVSLFTFVFLLIISFIPHLIEALILKKFAKLYCSTYRYKDGLINALSGSFLSGITPFASGGQFMQAYLFKKQGVQYADSTGLLLMHFILYQICLVGYTLLIVLFKYQEFSNYYNGFLSLALLGFLINSIVIIMLLLGALSYKAQYFLTHTILKIAYKFKLIKESDVSKRKLEKYLIDFREGLKTIRKYPLQMFSIILLFFIKLTILYSLPFCVLFFTQQNMSYQLFFDCFALCAFVYLITAFVPIPGSSGGTEGTYIILFSVLVGEVTGRFSMIVWRFITYYFTILIGCIIFMVYINSSKRRGKS